MCVTLTKSKKLACNSSLSGIKAIGVASWNSTALVKTATGVIDLATSYAAGTIARMEVKNSTINFVENGVSGGDSRSKGVTGNLPVILNVPTGADVEYAEIVEQLLNGEVCLFLEKKDGTIIAAGSQFGAQAVTVDDQTGGTVGDLNGFTVTFQTMEPDFSRGYILTGAALTEYAAALMATA
tara:strand:+ start:10147 stop:10692 length:546 start_codon:yes stop_codon:yes gene_type:complete